MEEVMEVLIKEACSKFLLPRSDIFRHRRDGGYRTSRDTAEGARRHIMYEAKVRGHKIESIAQYFGRHPTTVSEAICTYVKQTGRPSITRFRRVLASSKEA